MRLQKRIVERRHAGLVGRHVSVLVDGPSPEHALIVQGRLAGQAPEIDPVCYFTEADPELLRPGALVPAEIVDSRGYDLVVRPVSVESSPESGPRS